MELYIQFVTIRYATDETYKELVSEGVVIADFFTKTCAPCKMMTMVLEELDDEFPFLNIVKVDCDECPKTSEEFEIMGSPISTTITTAKSSSTSQEQLMPITSKKNWQIYCISNIMLNN